MSMLMCLSSCMIGQKLVNSSGTQHSIAKLQETTPNIQTTEIGTLFSSHKRA